MSETVIKLLLILGLSIILTLFYIPIARRFGILDIPKNRGSHTEATIRGVGVIIPIVAVIAVFLFDLDLKLFIASICFSALLGFLDDIIEISIRLRFIAYLLSVILCGYALGLTFYPILVLIIATFFLFCSVNAINFMDGINAISIIYAIVTLLSIVYVQEHLELVTFPREFLVSITLCLSVLGFLNIRKKAIAFLGDAGSITLGFISSFAVVLLIVKTQNFIFLAFLLLYGIDSLGSVIYRFWRGENILEAHRKHLYQRLANDKNFGHVPVAILYGLIQAGINYVVYQYHCQVSMNRNLILTVSIFMISAIGYYCIRKFYIDDLRKDYQEMVIV